MNQKLGRASMGLKEPVYIWSSASIVGTKEGQGPLGLLFDRVGEEDMFGCKTWEEAESTLQKEAVGAVQKGNMGRALGNGSAQIVVQIIRQLAPGKIGADFQIFDSLVITAAPDIDARFLIKEIIRVGNKGDNGRIFIACFFLKIKKIDGCDRLAVIALLVICGSPYHQGFFYGVSLSIIPWTEASLRRRITFTVNL